MQRLFSRFRNKETNQATNCNELMTKLIKLKWEIVALDNELTHQAKLLQSSKRVESSPLP